jgi:hypothetical protein
MHVVIFLRSTKKFAEEIDGSCGSLGNRIGRPA